MRKFLSYLWQNLPVIIDAMTAAADVLERAAQDKERAHAALAALYGDADAPPEPATTTHDEWALIRRRNVMNAAARAVEALDEHLYTDAYATALPGSPERAALQKLYVAACATLAKLQHA